MTKKARLLSIFSFFLLSTAVSGISVKTLEQFKGPYFGQEAPVGKAEVFMDGIISKNDRGEMNSCFSPDGRIFYFCMRKDNKWAIHHTREYSGKWTEPEALKFTSRKYIDRDFTLSPAGDTIYFGSNRPLDNSDKINSGMAVFYTKLVKGIWSTPEPVDFKENRLFGGNYPCVSTRGNLYFFRGKQTCVGKCDLMVSNFTKGKLGKPVCLNKQINSQWHDWDAYVSPDETYIIFSSLGRPENIGEQDLYISFRKRDGGWTRAKNMGEAVNSTSSEICPVVTIDGKALLFTSRRRGKGDIFWISAKLIQNLKPENLE